MRVLLTPGLLAVLLLWGSVRNTDRILAAEPASPNAAQTTTKAPALDAQRTGWLSFRNGILQQGVATSSLPDKLELLWKIPSVDGIPSTAAIADGIVYVGTLQGELWCLNLADGKFRWKYRSIEEVDPNSFAPGFLASPALTPRLVLIGDEDGIFHAIDRQTGKRVWAYSTDAKIISSANVLGEKVLFGSYDDNLYCLNLADGKFQWKFETQGYVHCSPGIADHFTFVTGCDEFLRQIDVNTGQQSYEIPLMSNLIASPAIFGEALYVGTYSSAVLAINWKTQEILWRYEDPGRSYPYYASAAVTDEYVIVGGHDKQVHCLDRKTGKPVWLFPTRGQVESSPVVVDQRVYFGSSDRNLYGLELKTGKQVWKYSTGQRITASPAVGDQCLVIGAEPAGGNLFCFGKPGD